MNVQVIYSSLSGCTRRLAEDIFAGLAAQSKSIHDLGDGRPELTGDVILLGYWVDKGGPNAEMREFMETVQGKQVGVFCTLAYWADSAHGQEALRRGVELVRAQHRDRRLRLQRRDVAADDSGVPRQHRRPPQRHARQRGALGHNESPPHRLRDSAGRRAVQ